MSATTYSERTNANHASPGRRAGSFVLALGIELLLLLAFFTLNFRDRAKPEFEGGRITTFDVAADRPTQSPSAQKQPDTAPRDRPRPVPPAVPPVIRLPDRPLPMLIVSKEVFEASDISKLGSNAPGASGQLAQGRSPGDSDRVGTAPNGEPLYAAEWYREPTHQELSTYLPKSMPEGGGWGMVACRTIDRFRVTDCVELDNSPPGSHLAGAVRQAAWQFLVRPPRVGGKTLVGTWVRIRVDYVPERSGAGR